MTTLLPAITFSHFSSPLDHSRCDSPSCAGIYSARGYGSAATSANSLVSQKREYLLTSKSSCSTIVSPRAHNEEDVARSKAIAINEIVAIPPAPTAGADHSGRDSIYDTQEPAAKKNSSVTPVVSHPEETSQQSSRKRRAIVYPRRTADNWKRVSHQRFDPPQSPSKDACHRVSGARYSDESSRTLPTEPFPMLQLAVRPSTPHQAGTRHGQPGRGRPRTRSRSESTPPRTKSQSCRERLSDASSMFVHSIKTASMTNASYSVRLQSTGVGRSGDSQFLGSIFRHSIDSDRPLTTSSIDDAAYSRGVRRKQILDELITTEESYVSDLKALVYLYSTLMASTTSITSSSRASIQRNVAGLLHLHEGFVDQLYQARFRAAARRWADTVSPRRFGVGRHVRWRSADAILQDTPLEHRRRPRPSLASTHMVVQHPRLGVADPADVLDVAIIFQRILFSLFIYEDYCANHEVVAHELQRQTPTLWSTYEGGIESLARWVTAIDQRSHHGKKGLTVGDLLIKPIQRICKYPLLLEDLLRHTPVADGPGAHEALDSVLRRLREIVTAVNVATDSRFARSHVQRRWLLQDRLNLQTTGISMDTFRELGQIHLCGVLFLTYQKVVGVEGRYILSILFDHHLILALPRALSGKFEIFSVTNLADLRIESPSDGKGIQCQSAFHTFKICFTAQSSTYEILLSACSPLEEDQWLFGLRAGYRPAGSDDVVCSSVSTRLYVDLKPTGRAFNPSLPLARQTSIQRAVTVGNRAAMCHVILRNTHNPQDWQEYRTSTSSSAFINRSHSHASANKVIMLAPKRSERTKLEASLSEIWTKDRLPFPGMYTNRGTQILRASAGSLARKLSLASIHAPFSKKSTISGLGHKKSYDPLHGAEHIHSTFEVRRDSFEDSTPIRRHRPKEVPELDTMDDVIGRMIGDASSYPQKSSPSRVERVLHRGSKNRRRESLSHVGPEDPATVFYRDSDKAEAAVRAMDQEIAAAEKVVSSVIDTVGGHARQRSRRKRWSNPINRWRGIGGEGIWNMLHSTSTRHEIGR